MLSIGRLALDATPYYEKSVAAGMDDYYAGRGEAPGRWVGAGAELLGLQGRVTAEQFQALMGGRDPSTGEQLAKRREDSIAALDLTFSAPKSVSVLFSVGDEELSAGLVAAHERAVDVAVEYLQEEACQVRRGHAGENVEPGAGFVTAAYRHRMSRAEDPQLHTHCVTANMARGSDGRWTALHAKPLFQQAKAAGHVYQAVLRREVTARFAWARWGEVRNGMAELDAVDPLVLLEFSTRRRQIEERQAELAAAGVAIGDRGRELIAHDTREEKDRAIETSVWRDRVRARAQEHGLGEHELAELATGEAGPPERLAEVWAREADKLVSPAGLTVRDNTFERRDVLIAFAQAAGQGASREQLQKAVDWFLNDGEVIAGAGERYSVRGLMECESEIVAAAGRDGTPVGQVTSRAVDRVLQSRAMRLTEAQEQAVRDVAGSGRPVDVIEALAGTGKTTTAGAIADVYRQAGFDVLGVAPTGRAVRELKEQAGIEEAFTLAQVLVDIERYDGGLGVRLGQDEGEEVKGRVVLLDEASMAATRQVAELVRLAERDAVKIIAIGDSGQLPSVAAGGWMRAIGQRNKPVRLTDVMRQRDARERHLLKQLHGGTPDPWIEQKLLAGQLRVAVPKAAVKDAVGRWTSEAARVGPAETVLITRNNTLRDILNRAIRQERDQAGQLGVRETYGATELAVGDRVICRQNDRQVDVDNGTRGTIIAVRGGGAILRTDNGSERKLPGRYCAEHVQHGYVLTAHGMQGATVESATVIATPEELTRNWSYTALSRAREPTELIVVHAETKGHEERAEISHGDTPPERDPLGEVARRMRQRDDQDLAIDRLRRGTLPAPGVDAIEQIEADAEQSVTADRSWQQSPTLTHIATDVESSAPCAKVDHVTAEPINDVPVFAEAAAADPFAQLSTRALRDERTTLRQRLDADTDVSTAEPAVDRAVALLRKDAIDEELNHRREQHVTAAVNDPQEHLTSRLGPRPELSDPRRERWDQNARRIEGSRFDYGITDTPSPRRSRPPQTAAADTPTRRRTGPGRAGP